MTTLSLVLAHKDTAMVEVMVEPAMAYRKHMLKQEMPARGGNFFPLFYDVLSSSPRILVKVTIHGPTPARLTRTLGFVSEFDPWL